MNLLQTENAADAGADAPARRQGTADHPRAARVGILGCGTVGGALARELLAERLPGARVVSILVRRAELDRGLPRELFATDFRDVLASKPGCVVEVMGGLEAAAELAREVLSRGIHLITANKTLVAHHGEELAALARRKGAEFRYEAAVGASLPIIASLRALRADRVLSIRAVLNGTCNHILEQMTRAGVGLSDAVREAQALGLAEPDPSADISGRDTAEKLCILAREIGLAGITPGSIPVEGIERVTAEDCRAARRDGRAIRLVASIRRGGERAAAECRVGPALVPAADPLGQLRGAENGVVIEAELAGRVVLSGKGAGPGPTAAALLGDLAALGGSGSARGSRPGECRAEDPGGEAVEHWIRVRRKSVECATVFGALRGQGVAAQRVEIGRGEVTVVTQGAEAGRARAVARALQSEPEASLVMPILCGK